MSQNTEATDVECTHALVYNSEDEDMRCVKCDELLYRMGDA